MKRPSPQQAKLNNEALENVKMTTNTITVLVVEDEKSLADLYSEWFATEEQYAVKTAYSGEEALDLLDPSIDIIILDRRMPNVSGDDVLEEISQRDLHCQVVMVTAVDPDFDIVEMDFDDYLIKPITKSDLLSVVDKLQKLSEYDDVVHQYYQLAAKKSALETSKSEGELAESEEYTELMDDFQRVQNEADTILKELSDEEFRTLI
ncbi:MAG: response regulator [Halobacteriaceae archaeon]